MLYVDGESKLAQHLASLTIASYTEQWSIFAPAKVLMEERNVCSSLLMNNFDQQGFGVSRKGARTALKHSQSTP
jgi:hypothetical protein